MVAFKCQDYVMVAASGTEGHYYIKIRNDEDMIAQLDDNKLVACSGENGDRVNFCEYVKANISLNRVRSHHGQSTPAVASWIREVLAKSLRRAPYQVQTLICGYDKPLSEHDDTATGANLYYCDYMGTLQAVPFAAHGYGATFAMALLDEQWRPDLTPQQGVDLMQKCCDEVRKRIIMSNDHFVVKVISKEKGIETVNACH